MKKTCEQILESLKGGYLDNELESSEREEINMHLERCSACRSAKDNLAAISLALRNAPRVNPPENLWPRIQAEIGQKHIPHVKQTEHTHVRFMHFFARKKVFAFAAAAALVLMAVGFHLAVIQRNGATAPLLTAILGNDEMCEPNLNFGSTIENYFL